MVSWLRPLRHDKKKAPNEGTELEELELVDVDDLDTETPVEASSGLAKLKKVVSNRLGDISIEEYKDKIIPASAILSVILACVVVMIVNVGTGTQSTINVIDAESVQSSADVSLVINAAWMPQMDSYDDSYDDYYRDMDDETSTEETSSEEVESETYTVNTEILKQVVSDSKTADEDVKNTKKQTSTTNTTAATTAAATTASSTKKTDITLFVTKDGKNVYNATETKTITLTSDEYNKLEKGSVYVDNNGSISTYTGAIYSTKQESDARDTYTVVTGIIIDATTITSGKTVLGSAADSTAEAISENETTAPVSNSTSASTESTTTSANETTVSSSSNGSSDSSTEHITSGASGTAADTTTEETTQISIACTLVMLEPKVTKETVNYTGWQSIDGSKYYFQNGSMLKGWSLVNGYRYYFNNKGVLSSTLVIDVSKFNGTIDWKAVKASGIEYAIIRAAYRGYGTGRLSEDSKFKENIANATAAGIKVGAYIFSSAINVSEAVDEASLLVSLCKPYNISLPLIIDVEDSGSGSGRADNLSAATRTAIINAFCSTIKSAGYSYMVYANKDWLTNCINVSGLMSGCKIWMAQYRSSYTYSGSFNMWQYTSTGSVSGISGNVDISAWLN